MFPYRFGRRVGYVLSVAMMTVVLGSCDLARNQLTYDRSAEMDRQDYRDALAPVALPPEDPADTPDFQPVVATPEELKLPSPLVTVSVNQTVSLRDLLFELAEQADIDLELDPQIHGSVIFTAKNRPFNEVIDRLCEMSGLRYKFKDNVLRVELDRPFLKQYNVDYLNIVRKGTSSVKASVEMGGSSDAAASTSGGSEASISNDADGDVWQELQENVEQILTSSDTQITLATLDDPVATPINTMPPPAPTPDPNNPNAITAPMPGQMGQMPASVPPTLSVSAVAGAPLIPSAPATYSISKQSGIMTVFASDRQQKMVEAYLKHFMKRVTTQVLIEAKVLQVDLTDEYATGIDWGDLDATGLLALKPSFITSGLTPDTTGTFTGVLQKGKDLRVAVSAINRFGTVRALSSPRVTVLNNQSALVNVADNNIYFNYDVETKTDQDTNTTTTTIDSKQKSAPEGVVMSVVPSANPDTGEVTLIVRPTVSRIRSTVIDPTIALTLAAAGQDPTTSGVPDNAIPEVSVQEIDSVLRLQSGQIIVMGGLMKDSNNVQQEGLPVISDLPFVGTLFKNHSDKVAKSELVIFIKATIVPGSNIDQMDSKMYNTFSQDRRPARM